MEKHGRPQRKAATITSWSTLCWDIKSLTDPLRNPREGKPSRSARYLLSAFEGLFLTLPHNEYMATIATNTAYGSVHPSDQQISNGEETPSVVGSGHLQADVNPDPTSLPKLQLFILCLIRLTEPISFTVIFPMVAYMIAAFDPTLPENDVGFYSGAIESVFSLAQFMTIMWWGKLSDRIGRKPVVLIGLAGISISTVSFGFSKSISHMMASRAIGGALNGNAAVIKSVVGEITTPSNQAIGVSLLPTFFAIGSTIGPILGGYLSRPAEQFPHSWFARSQYWLDHPWLLPCAVATLAPLTGLILGLIWLQETLPTKRRTTSERQPLLLPAEACADDSTPYAPDPCLCLEPPATDNSSTKIFNLLKDRNLICILFTYSLLSFQTIALEALIVLFAYTPINFGGIQFSSPETGLLLSISGILTLVVQLMLFPLIHKRFGTVKLYRLCMSSYPIIFLLFPLIHYIAVLESSQETPKLIGVWIGLSLMLILKTSANMVFSCSMLLVNSAAPTRNSLGTVNGLAQSCASFVRAVGPITATSLFAISSKHNDSLGGDAVFVLFAALASLAYVSSRMIKQGNEAWRNS